MSITTIAHQVHRMCAGEVIAKFAEDTYLMKVDNRVTKCPPSGIANKTTKPQVVVRLTTVATVLEESYRLTTTVLGHRPVDLLMVAIVPAAPAVTAISSLTAILVAEAVTAGAPRTELAGELGAEATAAAEAMRTATPPVHRATASTPTKKSKNYDAKNPPRQATTMASPPSWHGFAISFSR
jgi:hypothetical protein